jgi:Mg-chelatase subunit ChlD
MNLTTLLAKASPARSGDELAGLAPVQLKSASRRRWSSPIRLQSLAAFESNGSKLSCAILLDIAGSMADVLPVVKNSIIKLIDAMSDGDSVAVFGFANGLNRLQEFTTDKASAKQAVLRTPAAGATALFDAISEVAREISPRSGKKVLVVFTDGQDNASLLNADPPPDTSQRWRTIQLNVVGAKDAKDSGQGRLSTGVDINLLP